MSYDVGLDEQWEKSCAQQKAASFSSAILFLAASGCRVALQRCLGPLGSPYMVLALVFLLLAWCDVLYLHRCAAGR